MFVSALTSRYLEQGLIIPSLEDHNPAGQNYSVRAGFRIFFKGGQMAVPAYWGEANSIC